MKGSPVKANLAVSSENPFCLPTGSEPSIHGGDCVSAKGGAMLSSKNVVIWMVRSPEDDDSVEEGEYERPGKSGLGLRLISLVKLPG